MTGLLKASHSSTLWHGCAHRLESVCTAYSPADGDGAGQVHQCMRAMEASWMACRHSNMVLRMVTDYGDAHGHG